jgi:hypothetical protein
MTQPDLGPCGYDWCDRPAAVYVAGPTLGKSPRVTIIGGRRPAELAVLLGVLSLRCLDCAVHAVEEVAAVRLAVGDESNASNRDLGGVSNDH